MLNFDYLNNLNEKQKEAVTYLNGPLLIVAGAGSGKTKVLTHRIAYLIENGVDPFNILALTFTNKAASEMKDRIGAMVGPGDAKNIWMGTFHSIFARILRMEHERRMGREGWMEHEGRMKHERKTKYERKTKHEEG